MNTTWQQHPERLSDGSTVWNVEGAVEGPRDGEITHIVIGATDDRHAIELVNALNRATFVSASN